jgi:hypothetical protein
MFLVIMNLFSQKEYQLQMLILSNQRVHNSLYIIIIFTSLYEPE